MSTKNGQITEDGFAGGSSGVTISSTSSTSEVTVAQKIRSWFDLVERYFRLSWGTANLGHIERSVRSYERILNQLTGKAQADARVLEIGFGARPWRLVWLINLGAYDVGFNLVYPALHSRPGEFLGILRKNGIKRCLKTLVRFYLFDSIERLELKRLIGMDSRKALAMTRECFKVGDASDSSLWKEHPDRFDLIVSEDVFEHIPLENLNAFLSLMVDNLAEDGVAVICVLVFTGICGGHRVEWYEESLDKDMKRRSEPWEHLRQDRFPADSFLNRLTLSDYRTLSSQYFGTVHEDVLNPNLGREFFTGAVRAELDYWSEEALFTNTVGFTLSDPVRADSPETAG